jgi:hypothetical protein
MNLYTRMSLLFLLIPMYFPFVDISLKCNFFLLKIKNLNIFYFVFLNLLEKNVYFKFQNQCNLQKCPWTQNEKKIYTYLFMEMIWWSLLTACMYVARTSATQEEVNDLIYSHSCFVFIFISFCAWKLMCHYVCMPCHVLFSCVMLNFPP